MATCSEVRGLGDGARYVVAGHAYKELESVVLGLFGFALFMIPLLISGISLSQQTPVLIGFFGGAIAFLAAYLSAKWE